MENAQILNRSKIAQILLSLVTNISIGLIIIFSIYLSLASIVAIPEFQNRDVETIDNSNLAAFNKMLDDSIFYHQFNNLTIDTFKIVKLNYSASKNKLQRLNADIRTYSNSIWDARVFLNNEKKQVQLAYASFLQQKPSILEKNEYMLNLIKWYEKEQTILNGLASLRTTISDFFQDRIILIKAIDNNQLSKRVYNENDVNKEFDNSDTIYNSVNTWLSKLESFTQTFHAQYTIANLFPKQPKIGEEYGVFFSLSGWLLSTESMSLALIVGLFGFGLLGSISSSFIRRKVSKDSNSLNYIKDLPVVLVAGFSSAIVVFLAIKGSIIILGSKDSNVNPYLLFFICLVSAVYNEEIWQWAKERLFSTLNKSTASSIKENELHS